MVQIYRKKWQRNGYKSFFYYLRDCIINLLGVRRFSKFLLRLFFGFTPEFIFLVHARRLEDYFIGLPFLRILNKFISKQKLLKYLPKFSPCIIGTVRTNKSNGLIVSSFFMPEDLIRDKKKTLEEARRALRFCNKISCKNAVVGLGAWWPMVTRRGLSLENYGKSLGLRITNGHCGTLMSIFLMIESTAKISNLGMGDMNIAILGAGKMGSAAAYALYGRVKTLTLIDVNAVNLSKLTKELRSKKKNTIVQSHLRDINAVSLKKVLDNCHIGVCTTSNAHQIISSDDLPDEFIVIDDSRPEAISRETGSRSKIILEGGLIKIHKVKLNYDYGFGIDENVFGCLAESFILSIDRENNLTSTLGKVDMDNFYKMIKFCKNSDIEVGDFKTQDRLIKHEEIRDVVTKIDNRIKIQTRKAGVKGDGSMVYD